MTLRGIGYFHLLVFFVDRVDAIFLSRKFFQVEKFCRQAEIRTADLPSAEPRLTHVTTAVPRKGQCLMNIFVILVSFWPALSVALSFFSIIVNSARAINLFDNDEKQSLKQVIILL